MSEIQGHWFLKCSKNGEIQLNTDSDNTLSPLPFSYLSAAPISRHIL